jgi:hypothetical protein
MLAQWNADDTDYADIDGFFSLRGNFQFFTFHDYTYFAMFIFVSEYRYITVTHQIPLSSV